MWSDFVKSTFYGMFVYTTQQLLLVSKLKTDGTDRCYKTMPTYLVFWANFFQVEF